MRRWIPSPSLIIAMVALVVAVGGGTAALALRGKGTVRTDDIRKGAVRAKKIHAGAVNPTKTSISKFDFAGPEVSTTSNPPTTLSGGPSVTVFVPKGGLVAVYAEVEARITNGSESAQVHLFEPANFPNSPQIMERSATGFAVVRTKSGDNAGAASNAGGGAIFTGLAPGKHTFTLRYSATGGPATAIFRNRKLWVSVLS
jgi:hypothetical protein